jgi:hypothetical protein
MFLDVARFVQLLAVRQNQCGFVQPLQRGSEDGAFLIPMGKTTRARRAGSFQASSSRAMASS